MKKLFLSLPLLAVLAMFNACTTDVELYADYKDIPVIYGLLDGSQDTNYIRINRAFSGSNDNPINASEVALIADSCNYPGKLKAYIVEYKATFGNNYSATGDTLFLDTITIQDKEPGVFYSPYQKVYYTTDKWAFDNNSQNTKYRYKLMVFKDNDTISAETGLVGGQDFQILNTSVSFASAPSTNSKKVNFTAAENAVFYDVKLIFYYQETHNENGPWVDKQVSFSTGAVGADELGSEGQGLFVTYMENKLFELLTDAIGGDTVLYPSHPNVWRRFGERPVQIIVSAGGDELFNYIQINAQTGYSQAIPDYTNINGGYGVFSSRVNLVKNVKVSSRTQMDLYGIEAWGFQQY